MSSRKDSLAKAAFSLATGDEDARACREIPDEQCREQPRNFGLTLIALTATKTGDELASARLVLAWLLAGLGAPEFMLALLVPLRESGALLPQLLIAAIVRKAAIRKWFWVAGSIIQGLCLLGIGMVALTLSGAAAGWAILALLGVFALARGLCSVAIKDVMGKTIDKGKRGRLTGWASSTAGIGIILAGLLVQAAQSDDLASLATLVGGAGLLWLAAAAVYAGVVEAPGATSGGANALQTAWGSLRLLRDDPAFRQFCLTRSLLLATALAFPFYAALANQTGQSSGTLGLMVAAGGVAGLVAAPVWGRWADQSSRWVMIAAALLFTALGLGTVLVSLGPGLGSAWMFGLIYFVLAVSHHGIRIARSTYLVDMGNPQTRAAYTAVSNTLIGLLLLIAASGVGLLAAATNAVTVVGTLAIIALLAAFSAWYLPEVSLAAAELSDR